MDVIKLVLNKYQYSYTNYLADVVDIYINEQLFLNLNKRFHGHAPLTPRELYWDLIRDYKEASICIYGCQCGEPKCDPILVNIDVGEKVVMWYDLEFDTCGEDEDLLGEYGRFVFDKEQYFSEVEKMKNWFS